MMTADEVEQLAGRVLATRYPEADAGFAAGSIIRGDGTALSDLDLVVLFETLPHAGRASFTFEGLPVEAFIHDEATIGWYMRSDMQVGRPAHINMLAEGRIVGPRPERARELQALAKAILAAGPPPLDHARIDYLRYHITDKLDDLRDPRSPHEVVAIVAWLYPFMTELLFRSRGRWAANAKWAPRQLRAMDPVLESDLDQALESLLTRHDVQPLIDFTGRALEPLGGFLFDGFAVDSPVTSRLTADEPMPVPVAKPK
jgi:hypothetical protein